MLVNIGYVVYKGISPLKDIFLFQHFGFMSQCCHTPTCSVYLKQATQKEGFKGFCKGMKRVLTCC